MSEQEQRSDDPIVIVTRKQMVALGDIIRTQASELLSLRAEVERLKATVYAQERLVDKFTGMRECTQY